MQIDSLAFLAVISTAIGSFLFVWHKPSKDVSHTIGTTPRFPFLARIFWLLGVVCGLVFSAGCQVYVQQSNLSTLWVFDGMLVFNFIAIAVGMFANFIQRESG